jgi:hypothetical protein
VKSTDGLLDALTPASEVHWLRWEGGDAPTGNYTGDFNSGSGPLYHHTGRDELDAAIRSGGAVYLGLIDYGYYDYDYDYENDPGNLHYEAHEDALTIGCANWVIRYADCDYHGELKVVAVRLGTDVPDYVYDAFAAILAAKPDPQPIT